MFISNKQQPKKFAIDVRMPLCVNFSDAGTSSHYFPSVMVTCISRPCVQKSQTVLSSVPVAGLLFYILCFHPHTAEFTSDYAFPHRRLISSLSHRHGNTRFVQPIGSGLLLRPGSFRLDFDSINRQICCQNI